MNTKFKYNKLNFPMLVSGDLHAPYVHKHYLSFLMETEAKYKAKSIVFCGDEVDYHALSRHTSEPECDGVITELEKAKDVLAGYVGVFPKAVITVGNHSQIPIRQAKEMGIPRSFLRSANDLLNLPKEWEFVPYIVYNGIYIDHGRSIAKDAAINTAISKRMSYVQGHQHSWANVKYHANEDNIIFGMSVGCGIDNTAYAFAYGKQFVNKPILSCGVILSPTQAYVEVMNPDKYDKKKCGKNVNKHGRKR